MVTQRGFIPVDERMRVLDTNGNLVCILFSLRAQFFVRSMSTVADILEYQVPHIYCIGDANGKMMLAHAASAQGISGRW